MWEWSVFVVCTVNAGWGCKGESRGWLGLRLMFLVLLWGWEWTWDLWGGVLTRKEV